VLQGGNGCKGKKLYVCARAREEFRNALIDDDNNCSSFALIIDQLGKIFVIYDDFFAQNYIILRAVK